MKLAQSKSEKKGISIHNQGRNPPKKGPVIIQYSQPIGYNMPPQPHSIEELKGAKFAQSSGFIARPDFHLINNQGARSNFDPTPPQRFLVNSGHSSNQVYVPAQLPIYRGGQVQTVQTTVQPLYQSLKRTYVPHHIYNQIPLLNSERKHYVQEVQELQEVQEEVLEGADEQMLKCYESLFQKYSEQMRKNEDLELLLKQYELRKEEPAEVRQIIQKKEVLVEKPKKINVKLLATLIIKKNQAVIGQIVQRRKNACISKLRALFKQEEQSIKTTILRSSEEFTQSKIRTN